MQLGFWLRWSWRDLRARWLQVLAIGIIIALGTGVFAGLGGMEKWCVASYDLSYERLHMYDIHMELTNGSYLNGEELLAELSDVEGIATMETRLITETLVDASHDDQVIMVKGRLVGVDVSAGGPHVNGLYVDAESGRNLTDADAGQNVAIVEYKFALANDLEPGAPIRISGDVALDFVGAGHSPEYFIIMPETGAILAQKDYAVIFVPLDTAQRLIGRAGMVNDVVLLLGEGANRDAVRAEIESRMANTFPNVGINVMFTEGDPIYTLLYADAEGDQRVMNLIALLFLVGAALGAFNLAGRMVEAQRREIGIGMALGVSRRWIAFRPILVGAQIALLGTVFGLILGGLLTQAFGSLAKSLFPIPYWKITLYMSAYIKATALGILLPFTATLIPVWRAVRVQPIDAIKSGYLVAKGGGLSKLAQHLPLPGRSFTQMPIKNVLRSPWRTLLTVLGVAIAIMLATAVVGAMDSYVATMDQADDAFRYQAPDRYMVTLNFFYPLSNGEITSLRELSRDDGTRLFTEVETALLLGGTVTSGNGVEPLDILLELHDMETAIWRPALIAGSLTSAEPGVILSEKAAQGLGVWVGDMVTLTHPRREGLLAFRSTETAVPVIGIHNNPLRPLAYMDMSAASMMGLDGVSNYLVLNPAEGVLEDEVKSALLRQPGVTAVKLAADFSEVVKEMLEIITSMLVVTQIVAVVLAFLIAFNSTSISVDERIREIATMFAYGVRVRTVTQMQMLENFVIGVLGTFIGIGLGWVVLNSLFAEAEKEMPDILFTITISLGTVLLAAGLGILTVTLTPILSIRRMRNMDLPSTLRVME